MSERTKKHTAHANKNKHCETKPALARARAFAAQKKTHTQYYRDQLANERRGAVGFMCGHRRRRRGRHHSSSSSSTAKCAWLSLCVRHTIPCAGAEELNALNLSYMNGFSISEVDAIHTRRQRTGGFNGRSVRARDTLDDCAKCRRLRPAA